MKYMRIRWLCLVVISLSVLFWYGHLIHSEGSTIMPNTGLQGYTKISPGLMHQFLNMHCSQCALVSSSGQMLGAGIGEEIDKTECVIRMNNAPTSGYERDVGSRTSLRVVSHTSVPLLLKNESYYFKHLADTTYVFWGPERNMKQDGKGRIFNILQKVARKYPKAKLYVVTREKIQYCDSIFQNETGKNRMKSGAFLSTGFFTIILAMDVCDSIHVYGMIDDNYCSRANHSVVPYHYYERSRVDECRMYRVHERARHGGHRFITEKTIYARWALHHKMAFKHPSWRPQDKEHRGWGG
ncbi:alpha-N-acetyl-neuraminyl-2,3-beta-galactosyl-1,3-N-acetyl-galactosaminide alpha-2,6-sialyltransferase isoform X1 [Osmerus mordax]|uniref:alpha-N-acetyl-neuraminyl-2,3-beta-galactosyl-1, 3-N-acetyl-galactosaminide alpha-2,6-sialyltransferase isoform X1 n=3 Tax=Osmerus mordax TaxID=8014 RepID=UPI003510AF59